MHRANHVYRLWLASGGVAMVLWIVAVSQEVPLLMVLTGLIFLAWGATVAANVRGAADAMPTRSRLGPFRSEVSPQLLRLIFGGFALWGMIVIGLGIHGLVT